MSEISNEQLMDVLLDMRGDLGEIKANVNNNSNALAAHVLADAVMAADIKQLQLTSARQRGFLTAVSGVGGIIGAVVGYAASFFHR